MSAMYYVSFARIEHNNKEQQHHTIHPSHPIHPTRPRPAWDNVISPRQHWKLAIKHAKHLMKRDEKHRSFSLLWRVCLSVHRLSARTRDIDACLSKHLRHPTSFDVLPADAMRKRPWLRYQHTMQKLSCCLSLPPLLIHT